MRNQNIELLRIFAAFGIVLFHSGATGAELGYSGLIAFTAISCFFASGDAVKLTKRVLIPWAFWSLFYVCWRFIGNGEIFHEGLSPLQSIAYGTHLWYLPFIFVSVLSVSKLKTDRLPYWCAALAFLFLCASPWWRAFQMEFEPPIAQWLHALPAVFIGVACRSKLGAILVGFGLIISAMWQVGGVSLPYFVGGWAFIAAILLPRVNWDFGSVSASMLGVYLVHIAALGVFNRITEPETFLTAVLAFVASFAGVWVVRKYVFLSRWFLG